MTEPSQPQQEDQPQQSAVLSGLTAVGLAGDAAGGAVARVARSAAHDMVCAVRATRNGWLQLSDEKKQTVRGGLKLAAAFSVGAYVAHHRGSLGDLAPVQGGAPALAPSQPAPVAPTRTPVAAVNPAPSAPQAVQVPRSNTPAQTAPVWRNQMRTAMGTGLMPPPRPRP